ncbi:hypothetical protein CLV68_5964 [Actinokineospora cianjurensis]|uniref:Uncharacterized protein n=1 Tax=Actinokineospora cianjurensis TaxID=585224 RepID=A0A421AX80_9PSEU|nr:hypothetical protein CLV68_5964 [Actinokineospora cianjurensis]
MLVGTAVSPGTTTPPTWRRPRVSRPVVGHTGQTRGGDSKRGESTRAEQRDRPQSRGDTPAAEVADPAQQDGQQATIANTAAAIRGGADRNENTDLSKRRSSAIGLLDAFVVAEGSDTESDGRLIVFDIFLKRGTGTRPVDHVRAWHSATLMITRSDDAGRAATRTRNLVWGRCMSRVATGTSLCIARSEPRPRRSRRVMSWPSALRPVPRPLALRRGASIGLRWVMGWLGVGVGRGGPGVRGGGTGSRCQPVGSARCDSTSAGTG